MIISLKDKKLVVNEEHTMLSQVSIDSVYKKLKNEVEVLMESESIDFCTMSKIVHKLAEDFDSVIKKRYP